jgi:aminoglycoside/choline kinase family phosphotransferase
MNEELREWLRGIVGAKARLTALAGDAGFRRYFRVGVKGESYIALCAPPQAAELASFARVRNILKAAGVNVPEIYALDAARGFALLSDFGDADYAAAIAANPKCAKALYDDAAQTLIKIQLATLPKKFPKYGEQTFRAEMDLFPIWYIPRRAKKKLSPAHRRDLEAMIDFLARESAASSSPPVLVHRDYHSRNLMTRPRGENPGVLDFQDAVAGPPAYDAVSLWRDAYLAWDEKQTMRRLRRYHQSAGDAGIAVGDFADFARSFDLLGAQRHLKIMGIFTRLAMRDNKRRYLFYLPTVRRYLLAVCRRRRELRPLSGVLQALGAEGGE